MSIKKEEIEKLLSSDTGVKDFFVIDINVSPAKIINILIDKIEGIKIEECAKISRHLRHHLGDRSGDYDINVSSPGLDKPFKVIEQYQKNIGKDIKIQLKNKDRFKGKLTEVKQNSIIIEESKKNKRTKKTETRELEIKLEDIDKALVVIKI